ncbi:MULTISPECIES: putative phage abortive infection protein [Bacillus]|uniref:putative phage abortive infection protein n=1 Tax=Bacillus TaxID=1386 RepID=UPI0015F29A2D|nr:MULTISPECIES: putative phage abortive infection protein [Bacillus]MBI1628867.1 putative phage abortive infection protein [Bacillus safensis]
MKEWFKENKWTFFGWNVIGLAILAPTLLLIFRDLIAIDFNGLGPIGDFFGGTTVGLLTLASMLFVISSISMQRKQLDMQQDDLKIQRKELAKTRKEFELTNKTLTKQQFESTFFNMINLHHNMWKSLGSHYFVENYSNLREKYEIIVKNYWREELSSLNESDPEKLEEIVFTIFLNFKKINGLEKQFDYHRGIDFKENDLISEIKSKNENHYIKSLSFLREEFEGVDFDSRLSECMNNSKILRYFLEENSVVMKVYNKNGDQYSITTAEFIESFSDKGTISFIEQIRKETVLAPSIYKRLAYEDLYKEKEEEIGHYYRNLYRIVSFIQDEEFSSDKDANEEEQKKYRGILRAQLSSMELLMLFYNVVYSKKGEKFKELLEGTNFFDDHLIESKFLWANDKDELAPFR